MRPIAFLVPGPLETVSGGYEYDRRIIAGLRAAGQAVTVSEVAEHPHATWDALDPDAIVVIDGLALPEFATQVEPLAARGAVALIHHPTALETGTPEAERIRLRGIEQTMLQHLSCIIVTSPATRETLAQGFGVSAERIHVVMPGTEDAPRSSAAARGPVDGPCHVLSVGAVVPRKGHDVLLRALARLFDIEWRLSIVGSLTRDPAHAAMLRDLAGTLGIADRVSFAGEVDPAGLATLWDNAHVFALATHFEGYGMAVAEALKRGLPVAVCSGGAAAALVTIEAGVVCPPGDVDQLSKALRRLLFDRALRDRLAEAAWQLGRGLPDWQTQAALFAATLAGASRAGAPGAGAPGSGTQETR